MFTQAGNACTTSGTLECLTPGLTVVHPAIKTVPLPLLMKETLFDFEVVEVALQK